MRAGATAEALDRIGPCFMQRDIVEVPSRMTRKQYPSPKIPLWRHHGAKKYPIIATTPLPRFCTSKIAVHHQCNLYSSILSGKTLHPHGRGNRAPERSAPSYPGDGQCVENSDHCQITTRPPLPFHLHLPSRATIKIEETASTTYQVDGS